MHLWLMKHISAIMLYVWHSGRPCLISLVACSIMNMYWRRECGDNKDINVLIIIYLYDNFLKDLLCILLIYDLMCWEISFYMYVMRLLKNNVTFNYKFLINGVIYVLLSIFWWLKCKGKGNIPQGVTMPTRKSYHLLNVIIIYVF